MLTAEGCAARRQRLWQALPQPCDLLLLADPQHLIYFANYAVWPFTFRSCDAGGLLVLEGDRAMLVADNIAGPFAEAAHVDEAITPDWYEGKASATRRQSNLLSGALANLAKRKAARVGVELSSVPAGVVEELRANLGSKLQLVDLDPIIRPLRRAKDADELAVIKRSIRAAEAGFAAALSGLKPGMTELEAAMLVEEAVIGQAGERVHIYGDFAAGPEGPKTALTPTRRKLNDGDLFILDFSVVVHGYRSDFANTIAVGGKPSGALRERAQACLDALAAGEALLKPGTPARAIDAAIRASFAKQGLAASFTSHSGHGVGLGHPEPPYIVPESSETLVAGDVVALEPGQYAPEFGGMRFEHNYVITKTGSERLTQHHLGLTA